MRSMMPGSRELLFVSYQFPPFRSSGMSRVRNFLECLPEVGWDPVFLVPEVRAYPASSLDMATLRYVPSSVPVYRAPIVRPLEILARLRGAPPWNEDGSSGGAAASNGTGRGPWQWVKDVVGDLLTTPDSQIGWLPFALAAGRRAFRERRPGLVISTGPPWTSHLVARSLALRHRARWVADFRDPWVGNPFMTDKDTALRRRIDRRLEARVVTSADLVLANTRESREEMIRRYPGENPAKFHVMTNGFSPAERDEVRAWPAPDRDPGKLVLVHAGSFYGDRRPKYLLEAVWSLLREDPTGGETLRIELMGPAQDPQGLRAYLEEHPDVGRVVKFHGVVPREEALRSQHAADVLVLMQPDAPLQVPGKLFEYLLFEKPILALVGEGATRNLLTESSFARVLTLGDTDALRRVLRELLQEHRRGTLPAGIDASSADRFDFSSLCQDLAQRIDSL